MSEKLIQDSTLQGIANAIRSKDGTSQPIQVSDMAMRITSISSDYDGARFFDLIVGEETNNE